MEIGIPLPCFRILRIAKLNSAEDAYVFVLQYILRLVTTGLLNIKKQILLQPVPVAARSNALVCGRSPAEIEGFESHRGHGSLSLVSVVCCQVEISVTS